MGDTPWVAQSLEAFTSKLFALSYSVATLGVSSGNPLDHLVHRHTHRVVRGGLLAVGRPDGRLNGLASAEATCNLSVRAPTLPTRSPSPSPSPTPTPTPTPTPPPTPN